MLPNTVTLASATTGAGENVVLTKRSEQNGVTRYTGSYTFSGKLRELRLEIKHTLGSKTSASSSVMKLETDFYDSDGAYVNTTKTWQVFENSTSDRSGYPGMNNFMNAIREVSTFMDEFNGGSY